MEIKSQKATKKAQKNKQNEEKSILAKKNNNKPGKTKILKQKLPETCAFIKSKTS